MRKCATGTGTVVQNRKGDRGDRNRTDSESNGNRYGSARAINGQEKRNPHRGSIWKSKRQRQHGPVCTAVLREMPGYMVRRNKESYIHDRKSEGRFDLTPQELTRRACHGDEQIAREGKSHEKTDESLYVLVVNYLAYACRINKQQAYKDRHQRIGQ